MPAAVQPVHNLNWNRPFSQAKSATSILPLLLYRVGGPIRAPAFGVRTRCSRYCLLLLVLKSTSSIDLDRPILILYAQSAIPAEESVVCCVSCVGGLPFACACPSLGLSIPFLIYTYNSDVTVYQLYMNLNASITISICVIYNIYILIINAILNYINIHNIAYISLIMIL